MQRRAGNRRVEHELVEVGIVTHGVVDDRADILWSVVFYIAFLRNQKFGQWPRVHSVYVKQCTAHCHLVFIQPWKDDPWLRDVICLQQHRTVHYVLSPRVSSL